MSTLKDVAALSGVHPSTVSRVLRGKEHIPISDETRQRIISAVKQLNYEPDRTAQALRLKKSHTVGLIIPDVSNSFFSHIAQSIGEHSYNAGYTLVVCGTNEDQSKEIQFVNDLLSRGIDGLLIVPVQDCDEHLKALRQRKVPFVLIDRYFEDFETNAVISDNEDAARKAIRHLAELGHSDIAYLSGRPNIYTIRKRLDGYKKAMQEHGLNICENRIAGSGFTLQSGYEATLQLLALPHRPTALLTSGNLITIGAIKAIIETGLNIPQDISIVGFTDTMYAPYLISPLTAVSHPVQAIGKKAFELLHQQMKTKKPLSYTTITVKTDLIVRKSTGKCNV
jgi:DNA-binding LacI/PurR family transcriptional regulator